MKQITVTITEETIKKIVNEIERRVQMDVEPSYYDSENGFDSEAFERAYHNTRVNMMQGAYSTIVSMVKDDDLAAIWNAFDEARYSK